MLVFCITGKRKLSFTFRKPRVLAALPAIPLRNIPATGVVRPCGIPTVRGCRGSGEKNILEGSRV
jgi:hypothetical protein